MSNLKIVGGLGNPGAKYRNTYHNLGYMAVDTVIQSYSAEQIDVSPGDLYSTGQNSPQHLGKPDEFVNNSGSVLKQWADHFSLKPESFLIIYDDFELELGQVRIRESGSAGGHNGMKSIINAFQTSDIPRLRIGFGPLPAGENPVEFVLNKIVSSDRKILSDVFSHIPKIINQYSETSISDVMDEWNGVTFDG